MRNKSCKNISMNLREGKNKLAFSKISELATFQGKIMDLFSKDSRKISKKLKINKESKVKSMKTN